MIDVLLEQFVQAADNLRLFEETQERAGRERTIAEIGDKMRNAPTMEALMETTISELTRILGPDRAFVQVASKTSSETVNPVSGQPTSTNSNGHNSNKQAKA